MTQFGTHGTVHGNGGAVVAYVADALADEDRQRMVELEESLEREQAFRAKRRALRERRPV